MEEQDKVKYQELKERTGNVLFDNVKGQIDVSKHRQLIVDIVDTVGKDVEKITDNSTDMNQKFEEYKESQSELNAKQDIDINKNLQNINQLNKMIKLVGQKDEPILKAKGGGVVNLPNNAMKSVAPNYKFEGLTLENLYNHKEDLWKNISKRWKWEIKDDGTVDWIVNDPWQAANIGYGNYKVNGGDKWYVNFDLKATSNFLINMVAMTDSNANSVSSGKIINIELIEGVVFKASTIIIITKPVNEARINFKFNTTNNNIGDLVNARVNNIINLTQTFGAGNEPSKEWCDEHIQGYFEGIKSVQTPMRVKSVGKNLFDKSAFHPFDNNKYISRVMKSGRNALSIRENFFINLFNFPYKKNTQYSLIFSQWADSASSNGRLYIKYTDGSSDSFYAKVYKEWETHRGVSKYGKTIQYIGFTFGGSIVESYLALDDLTIVEGSGQLEYPILYTESNLYLNNQLELKSVGSTKDYIEDGKLYKNIEKYKLPSGVWTYRTKENELHIYSMELPKPAITKVGQLDFISNEIAVNETVDILRHTKNEGFTPHSNGITVYFATKDNVNPNNYFKDNEVFVEYKLDKKEVIYLDTSGFITNHPNGTIFIEPISNVTLFYNDGLDVSKFNIESVEEFAVFKDGNYQSLDISKIEITDNKLTHPDAINGLCYLVFRYDNNPIFGDNEVEYYNNDGILVSPDGTFWKPVLTVDDEGNILMKGEKL